MAGARDRLDLSPRRLGPGLRHRGGVGRARRCLRAVARQAPHQPRSRREPRFHPRRRENRRSLRARDRFQGHAGEPLRHGEPDQTMTASPRTVAIAGFGAIGREVARRLDAGIPGFTLVAIAARDSAKAERNAATLRHRPRIESLAALPDLAQVIVECVPAAAFVDAVGPGLDAGRIVLTVSGAALLDHPEMAERARKSGGRLILATGALLGLDAVRAAAIGSITSVRFVTRKPPRSLARAPHLQQPGIRLDGLTPPPPVFARTPRHGAPA